MKLFALSFAAAFMTLAAVPPVLGQARTPPRTSTPAKAQPAPKPVPQVDRQTLVSTGKIPAFFDPADLSKSPVLSAKAALLMDADTGEILWEKNGTTRRAPASTTKIMTALLLLENTNPDDVLTVTNLSAIKVQPSSLNLKQWEKLTARDMLYGLLHRSANDGAILTAHHLGGSIAGFSTMMNVRARELGAVDTQFRNPHGLTEDGHYTTARDIAVIARAALNNPMFADAVSSPRSTISRSINVQDVTLVAGSKKFFEKFPGADGVKTGYTRVAGYCFVGSATRDGRRLISVVLGAHNSATVDTIPLLSWGFRRFPSVVVARQGDVVGTVPVRAGAVSAVQARAGETVHTWTDAVPGSRSRQIETVVEAEPVSAPVTSGQEVGRLVVKVDGKEVRNVPIHAAVDVARSPIAAAAQGLGGMGTWGLGACLLFVGVRVGRTAAKGARRRRNRFAPTRRRVNSRRAGVGGWDGDHYSGHTSRYH